MQLDAAAVRHEVGTQPTRRSRLTLLVLTWRLLLLLLLLLY